MYLYHFTSAANVDSIRGHGIRPGEYPFRELGGPALVSLTRLLDPTRHGLYTGELVKESQAPFVKLAAKFPWAVEGLSPSRTIKLPDLTEVAIKVRVDPTDRRFLSFDKYAKTMAIAGHMDVPKLKAAALASADFPLGDGSDDEVFEHARAYWALESLGKLDYRGWYFYKGVLSPVNIHEVLWRRQAGGYAPKRRSAAD